MIISQEHTEIEAARELISKSELKRLRLRRCYAVLEGEEIKLKEPFGLAQSHSVTAIGVIDGNLRVEVAFRFQGFDSSEGKAPLFGVECSFDLDYEVEDGYHPSPEAISAFKNGNAIFNCWPYARECVQNLTFRMGLRTPPLSLLRMIPKPRPKPIKSEQPNTASKKE
jgi:hypothetical protein